MYNTPTRHRGAPGVGDLLRYFLRLGTVGFGGPAALAARMQRELVEERGWVRSGVYLNGLAFAQLAPGPLAAQLAMYLGYECAGVAGCTVAAIGIVLPSFLMVLGIASLYRVYGALPAVRALFYGVGPAAIGIMTVAAARLGRKTLQRETVLWLMAAASAAWTAVSERELVSLFIGAGLLNAAVRAPRLARGAPHGVMPLALGSIAAAPVGVFAFFVKAGLFVFGSGLAIVPFLYRGVVIERGWLTDAQFVDAVAVAMITPGPVVITAVFVGFLAAGIPGAFAAAAGVFGPVYLMVLLVAPLFARWVSEPVVRAFVAGVTAAAVGAIGGATYVLAGRTIHDPVGVVISMGAMLASSWRMPEPAVVAAAAALGLLSAR